MPQIINSGPTFGGRLGEALGSGIGTGLAQLAERKLSDITERNQAKSRFGSVFGDEETSRWVNSLPPKEQLAAIQWLTSSQSTQPQAAQQIAQQFQPVQQNVRQLASDNQPVRSNADQSAFLQQLGGLPKRQQFQQQPLPQNLVQQRNLADQLKQQQEQQALSQRAQQQQAGQQQMAQQQQQLQQQAPQRPTLKGALANAGRAETPVQQARNQTQINKQNANWVKAQQKTYEVAKRSSEILDEMEQLVNTGQVSSGFGGTLKGWAGTATQNTETQQFDKLSNELAGLLASNQSGVLTNGKIKFAQSQKPNLTQSTETQLALINRLKEQTKRPLLMNEIKDQLIAENDYQEPAGLETRVNQILKEYEKNPGALQARESAEGRSPEEGATQAETGKGESPIAYGARNLVRGVSRAGEALAGTVGDIASAGLGLANYATGGATPTYADLQDYLPISPPTSEQIKEKISNITNGYTDPVSEGEKAYDSIVGTVASLFGPGAVKGAVAGAAKGLTPTLAKAVTKGTALALPFSGVTPLKKAIALGVSGEAGAKVAEGLGAGPAGQAATRLAFMAVAGSRGTRQQLDNLMTAEYDAAKAGFAGKTVDARQLRNEINKFSKTIEKRALPNKEIARDIVNEAYSAIEGNNIPVSDLIQLKQDLNKYYKLAINQRVPGEKHLPKELRPILGELIDLVKKPIQKASELYPEGGKPFAIAEDIVRGTNTFEKSTQFLKDHVNITDKLSNSALKGSPLLLPGYLIGGVAGAAGSAAAGITTAFAAKNVAVFKDLIKHSPKARELYWNAIKGAANDSKPAVVKNLALLDKELTRYEKRKQD